MQEPEPVTERLSTEGSTVPQDATVLTEHGLRSIAITIVTPVTIFAVIEVVVLLIKMYLNISNS
jgi:hypothetical protein